MIRDSKLREDAPQTLNEKNKSGKKRCVSIFESLKNVTVCHDSKDLQLHGNQFILTEIVDHIIRTTNIFYELGKRRGRNESQNNLFCTCSQCHSIVLAILL